MSITPQECHYLYIYIKIGGERETDRQIDRDREKMREFVF